MKMCEARVAMACEVSQDDGRFACLMPVHACLTRGTLSILKLVAATFHSVKVAPSKI